MPFREMPSLSPAPSYFLDTRLNPPDSGLQPSGAGLTGEVQLASPVLASALWLIRGRGGCSQVADFGLAGQATSSMGSVIGAKVPKPIQCRVVAGEPSIGIYRLAFVGPLSSENGTHLKQSSGPARARGAHSSNFTPLLAAPFEAHPHSPRVAGLSKSASGVSVLHRSSSTRVLCLVLTSALASAGAVERTTLRVGKQGHPA